MTSASTLPLAGLKDVWKGWMAGRQHIDVLRNVSLEVFRGESLAIVGPSGAGKSTILHLLGLLTPADRGEVFFEGRSMNSTKLWWDKTIRRSISMIFQDARLIPNLTVRNNVCVPLLHRGVWPQRQRELAAEALKAVGLDHRMNHTPNQLSGGELMRVAIARALVTEPRLILADEPTGTLDSKTGEMVIELLFSMVSSMQSLVIVTHHHPLALRADRILRIKDGNVHVE